MESIDTAQLSESAWKADLQLTFIKSTQTNRPTILSKRRFFGPLVVQKPFYPEQDVCHIYLLHPPGGVVGGDRLKISLDLQESANCVLTTPAANKFYRSDQYTAEIEQFFDICADACLEWLPQENIFFSGSEVKIRTRINLHPAGKLVAWEILCLGRPAAGEDYQQGKINQRLELFIQHQRCFTDHLIIRGGSDSLNAAWGLAGFPVVATMLIYPGQDVTTQQLMAHLGPLKQINREEVLSISIVNKLIVCRYLGYHGERARHALTQVWATARPHMLQKKAIKPRIWAT